MVKIKRSSDSISTGILTGVDRVSSMQYDYLPISRVIEVIQKRPCALALKWLVDLV